MNKSRLLFLVAALWFFLGVKPSIAAPDEYDDSQSHPLRIAAYLLYPAAWLVEWTVFRPFHYIVSATEPQETLFGHTPHPPVLAGPQPIQNYGMPQRVSMKPTPVAPVAPPAPVVAKQEPPREVIKIVEVPVEKVVFKEVQKIVEVEKFVLPAVAFRFDSADLTDLGKGQVYLAAQRLKEKSDLTVIIEGHTDNVGSDEYNQKLGQRRAQTVVNEISAQGIDPSRISATGIGENRPLINQETEWARAVNRRVEFQVKAR
jgi:outer membrane protein OmpA-like peptidoglycan-associated protein